MVGKGIGSIWQGVPPNFRRGRRNRESFPHFEACCETSRDKGSWRSDYRRFFNGM